MAPESTHDSYFARNYSKLSFPLEEESVIGFRPAQLAAIQAVNAHLYSRPDQAAIVIMPTGSGKTLIINTLAFTQRARRVLVLTPTRLVREQIAQGLVSLSDLRVIQAVPADLPGPAVFSTKGRIGTDEAWENLRDYDVVVATVPSISPAAEIIPEPPPDLFDLILVDEAHHSPARTWRALLERFSGSKRVHFTATPFRNDEKEIQGRIVFNYDIRHASNDQVFGDIRFVPVTPRQGEEPDAAIAKAAERQLRSDQSEGLRHLLMVRTDSRQRADSLMRVYSGNTDLKLRLIAGNQSLRHVKGIIEELRAFQLDGVICVNMLAEGFNLPNLKVAAIHTPHRSLAVTLQFIGRFARTNAENIGIATFLAVPSEIRIETTKLFQEGAIWRDIVQNLSAARVEEEVRVREYLDTFDKVSTPDLTDFSLYALQPYCHVKILSVPDGVDLSREAEFPRDMAVIFRGYSDPHAAVIYITREAWRSPWSDDDRFTNVEFDMFVLHHNAESGLLFICASRRQQGVYDRLARSVSLGTVRLVSLSHLNRVLNDLERIEFFNIGMRNRSTLGTAESYRTLTGPAVDKAVQKSDGRLFDRGHCFGKATEDGTDVTIGLSSASKVWSNTSASVPELIEWCDRLAAKIDSGHAPVTGSGLDYLSAGEELNEIPEGIRVACWNRHVYSGSPTIRYQTAANGDFEIDLLELDLIVRRSDETGIHIRFVGPGIEYNVVFSIDADRYFNLATTAEPAIAVTRGWREIQLVDYLNEEPLSFYTNDLSRIEGHSLYRTPDGLEPYDIALFESVDWVEKNVSIKTEKPPASDGKRSIFEWLEERLIASDVEIVFFDDRSGEMADYIAVKDREEFTLVTFYHCKASKGGSAGERVEDAYVVCGQAIKSGVWARERLILKQFAKRVAGGSRYLRGDKALSDLLLGDGRQKGVRFEVVVVQPGFRRSAFSEKIASLAAAANDYLVHGGLMPLRIIGSA